MGMILERRMMKTVMSFTRIAGRSRVCLNEYRNYFVSQR
jgi:hypothetical protein